MLHKKDLVEGAILPIYTNHKDKTGFLGMARLIKEVDFDKSANSYVEGESDFTKVSKYYKGGRVAIKNKGGWEIKEIAKAGNERLLFTDDTFIDKPFKIRDMLSSNYNYLLEGDGYKRVWSVYSDSLSSTVFIPVSRFLEGTTPKPHEIIRIQKPYEYKIDPPDSIIKVFRASKWLVEYLNRAFPSNLKGVKSAYYKDFGLVKLQGISSTEAFFYHPDSKKLLTGDFGDFYVLGDNMRKASVYIGYHSRNCRNILEQDSIFEREIDDEWEREED